MRVRPRDQGRRERRGATPRGGKSWQRRPRQPPHKKKPRNHRWLRGPGVAGSTGLEPVASGVTAAEPGLAGIGQSLQPPANTRFGSRSDSSTSPGLGAFSRPRVTPGLQSPSVKSVPSERLLSVRQVAGRLGVSTSTIYALCQKGGLPHVRVSNAIRVAPGALEELVGGGACLTEPLTVGVVSSATSRRGVAVPREPGKASKNRRSS